jgi:hypothetical protein
MGLSENPNPAHKATPKLDWQTIYTLSFPFNLKNIGDGCEGT